MATRQNIRSAIKLLVEPLFTAVFDYRPAQVYEGELPCCAIYFEDGETERDFDGDGVTSGRLILEVMIRSVANIDGDLDQYGSQVEELLRSSSDLNGLVEDINRIGFSYDRDPESNSGALSLTHLVHYQDED